jgi:hypothetical protein
MPQVTIIPRYVNEPKPGKKFGTVRTHDDVRYVVPAALIAHFEPGAETVAHVKVQQWSGESVNVVESVPGALPENGSGGISTGTVPVYEPAKPVARHSNGNGDAERIFVCAALKSLLESGRLVSVDEESLVESIAMLRRVYARTFGRG